MQDLLKRIEAIEKEIRKTPYHKGTEHHIGQLRARLRKLQNRLVQAQTKKGARLGFAIKKHGDAGIVLVGFPSVGKSTLLNRLTNARSPVAPYEFTTVSVIPGIMRYKGAQIQILDVPGLIEGASEGKGRGREVLSVVRAADLLILMAEVGREKDFKILERELHLNEVNAPSIYVVNKIDKVSKGEKVSKVSNAILVSAEKDIGLEKLREAIWKELGLVRVYLRKRGGTIDRSEPMIMRDGQTLKDVAEKVGKEFAQVKKEAKIWGPGAKFSGQETSLQTLVQDEMEVMFI